MIYVRRKITEIDLSTMLGVALSLSALDFARADPELVEGSKGDCSAWGSGPHAAGRTKQHDVRRKIGA